MKTYRVVIAPHVVAELEAVYQWIARNAPSAAAIWYDGAIDSMESLRRFPLRAPIASESRSFGREVRCLVFGNYRILFLVRGRVVHILNVIHGARRRREP
jgi:plasmid stabilization system protein ParE